MYRVNWLDFFFFLEIYYGENLRCWGLYLEEEVFTFCKQVIAAWKMGEIINSFFFNNSYLHFSWCFSKSKNSSENCVDNFVKIREMENSRMISVRRATRIIGAEVKIMIHFECVILKIPRNRIAYIHH